jgi:polyisoprenoid-binding protein YceI
MRQGNASLAIGTFVAIFLATVTWNVLQPSAVAQELQPLTIDTELSRVGDHPWKIDTAASSLRLRVNQGGTLMEGAFTKWDAQINLDPDNLDTAFVDARIDMTSLELGEFSEHAKSPDFLNVASFAEARFLSDFFWLRGDGKIDAEGLLEVAGVTKPFILTFALVIDGKKATMSSYSVINRSDYEVGTKQFNDEKSVGFNVEIATNLVAEKQW